MQRLFAQRAQVLKNMREHYIAQHRHLLGLIASLLRAAYAQSAEKWANALGMREMVGEGGGEEIDE